MLSYFLDQIPASILPSSGTSPSQECYNRLLQANAAIQFRFRCTSQPGLESASPAVETISGYPLLSFYSEPDLIFRIIHPQDRAKVRDGILRGTSDIPLQIRWQHAEGSIIHLQQVIVPVYDEAGKLVALEGAAHLLQSKQPAPAPAPDGFIADYRHRLLEISRQISESISIDDVLAHIFKNLEESLQFDSCRVIVHSGQEKLAAALRFAADRTSSGKIHLQMSTNRSEVTTGILRLPHTAKQPAAEEMSMRLRLGSEVFGSVHFTRPAEKPFSEHELDMAHICVFYASMAAESSGLLSRSESHVDVIERMVPTSEDLYYPFNLEEVGETIGRHAMDITGLDAVSVMRVNDGGALKPLYASGVSKAYLAHLAFDQSNMIEGAPLEKPEIQLIDDIQNLPEESLPRLLGEAEGFRSLAVCPLISRSSLVATVNCYGPRPRAWSPAEKDALDLFGRQAGVIFTNTLLYTNLEETYRQTVQTLARAIDIRDTYTSRHSYRLADWAEQTARLLHCTEEEIRVIRSAALLHDIGKIGIPDSILSKAGPLTEGEWEIMRRHPVIGAEIIAPIKNLEDVIPIIRWHQEKYDGSGYPDGLYGEQIPLAARILTVVDAYGAMTDDRLYRKALSDADAVEELKRCSGTHFDSLVVQEFFKVIKAGVVQNSLPA